MSEEASSEVIVDVDGGCRVCHKGWPQVTFRNFAGLAAYQGASKVDALCDLCWDRPTTADALAASIDEAQATFEGHDVQPLERRILVCGIKSGTNLIGFEYATHREMKPLITTNVTATFLSKNNERSVYVYADVPVAVCEAWYAAPSKGGYFQQFIRNSYHGEKVK